MEEIKYKVYAKKDEQESIIDIWSTGNQVLGDSRTELQMIEQGYEFIDEGADGNIYGYAQVNYTQMKHGKALLDEKERPNFHGNFITCTEEEKEKLYPPAEPQPTQQDLINADIYMQLAILQSKNISIANKLKVMSPRYELLKNYYDMGIYTKENLRVFIVCEWLTEEEYQDITKESK